MKIYTNDGNPLGLKLALLAKFAKREVTVERVSLDGDSGDDFLILPTFELDDGTRLFSTDAVAKYLFPDEGLQRDEWLEWSSSHLAVALFHQASADKRTDSNAAIIVKALLKKIDSRLKDSPFLAGESITAADLSVWCLLSAGDTMKNIQSTENLLRWHQKLCHHADIVEVTQDANFKDLTFAALQKANRYGGLLHEAPKRSDSVDESTPTADESVTEEELLAARGAFIFISKPERNEPRVVLPRAGERNVLITSALPYVNNVPHLGNIIGCVLSADIFARYARSAGYNTLFICGTDEYGTATENKAMAENMTPKQICDKYFELHNSIYCWFGIGFDYFGRTTNQEQTDLVQEAFKQVRDAGYVLTESVEQLLCEKCDRFLADRFVEGICPQPTCRYEDARGDQCDKCGKLVNAIELINPRCNVCGTAPVVRSSEQMFIDLPKIEPQLNDWLQKASDGWSSNARTIARSWLREGLKPRCITRDLKWGIPVPHPGFENKVFYVWFDAPFGYVSMTKRYCKEYGQWWQPAKGVDVELFQFMAKDNVPFHAIIWPSILLAINRGYTLVAHLMATEYLNYEDGKFSKSRGIGVFGNDAQETGIPADVWRFYLASARPEAQDSSFSWNDLAARNNSELLNNLGNFVNRALVFCEKNYDSTVPNMMLSDEELTLLALVNREYRGYVHSLEKAKMRDGIRHLLAISRHGNGYMQSQQPWVLCKGSDEQKMRAATIIGVCCNLACLLANLLFPFMPQTARNLFAQLNAKQSRLNVEHPYVSILLERGHKLGKPEPLFTKLEQTFIDELKRKFSGPQVVAPSMSRQQLEEAIKRQEEKIQQLDTKCQPEVDILCNLQKQLLDLRVDDGASGNTSTAAPPLSAVPNGVSSNEKEDKTAEDAARIKQLENDIAKQGIKVRNLKASSDASIWKPEVEVLLSLKKELATITGAPVAPAPGKNKKRK